jgi:hypothetical protein
MALTDGMAHCWRFDTNTGFNVSDLGTDPVTLTLPNDGAWFTDGTWGVGWRFDVDHCHAGISALTGWTGLTMMAFFRQPVSGGQWAGINLGYDNSNYANNIICGINTDLEFLVLSNFLTRTIANPTDNPHVYLLTSTGVEHENTGYLDATSGEQINGGLIFNNIDSMTIGSCGWDTTAGDREFYIVAIWNRVLTSDEISTLISNPYAMLESEAIRGSTSWGQSTGTQEGNARTFSGNWTGTGFVSGSGNNEKINLSSLAYMESEVVNTGVNSIDLYQNRYSVGDTGVLKYRSGSSVVDCESATWQAYSGSFTSLGYAQIRVGSSQWWLTNDIVSEDIVAIYQAKGVGNYNNSLQNIIRENTYVLFPVSSSPIWDTINGWAFDGTNTLTTGIIPSNSTWSYIIRFSNWGSPVGTSSLIGGYYGDCDFSIQPNRAERGLVSNGNYVWETGTYLGGVYAVSGKRVFRGGVYSATIQPDGVPTTFSNIYIGSGICKVQAIAVYNKTLTDTQVSSITDNVKAL